MMFSGKTLTEHLDIGCVFFFFFYIYETICVFQQHDNRLLKQKQLIKTLSTVNKASARTKQSAEYKSPILLTWS
ncbi:hypothetical protein HanPSC8_Chr15g0664221 [Helianthus annuus]|nr:hypothetical protein HanPSC8_Chr15g0664221 [Helianthus annuus]